jgi:nitroreductase
MDTIAAIHARRSIRDYAPRAVEQSLIEAVIDDAAQAPWTPLSASEPWVFTVIRGAERIRAYGARALQYARDNRHALEECTRAGQTLSIAAVARGLGSCWVGAPVLWLHDPDVCGELAIPGGFTPHAVFTLGYGAAIPKNPGITATRTNWIGDGDS